MKKPLSEKEKKWIKRAQKVFDDTPERFDFLTIGDPNLEIIERKYADDSELCDGAWETDGLGLGTLYTKGRVHGVAG